MRRSIFKAGVWTALGLAIAFAIVSANSNTRRAVTTAAPAAQATVATAPAANDDCTSSDVCCAKETKVNSAAVAAAPRKKAVAKAAQAPAGIPAGANGMIVAIDPETGELTTPTAEQINELQGQVVQPTDEGTVIHFPNGAIGSTGVSTTDYTTIHIDATGKKIIGHGEATAPVQPAKPALEEK